MLSTIKSIHTAYKVIGETATGFFTSPAATFGVAAALALVLEANHNLFQRKSTEPLRDTAIHIYDGILKSLLAEHRANLKQAQLCILKRKLREGNNNKTTTTSNKEIKSDENEETEEVDFLASQEFVALPLSLTMSDFACLVTNNNNNNNNREGTRQKGVVKNVRLDPAVLFPPNANGNFNADQNSSMMPRTNTSGSADGDGSVEDLPPSFGAEYFDANHSSLFVDIEFNLRLALVGGSGQDREHDETRNNYLILSPKSLQAFGGSILQVLVLLLEICESSSEQEGCSQAVISNLVSIISDVASIVVAKQLVTIEDSINIELKQRLLENPEISDPGTDVKSKNEFLQQQLDMICNPNSSSKLTKFFEYDNVMKAFALLQHLCGDEILHEGLISESENTRPIFDLLFNSNILFRDVFFRSDGDDSNSNQESITTGRNLVQVPLIDLLCPPTRLAASTHFANSFYSYSSMNNTSSVAKRARPSFIHTVIYLGAKKFKNFAANLIETSLPFGGVSAAAKSALAWIPRGTLYLNLGSFFLVALLSNTASKATFSSSLHSSAAASNIIKDLKLSTILASVSAAALQSSSLSSIASTLASALSNYASDRKLSKRWLLLSMTTDLVNTPKKAATQSSATASTKGNDNIGMNRILSDLGINHLRRASGIRSTLRAASSFLETIPAILADLRRSLFTPTTNFVSLLFLAFVSLRQNSYHHHSADGENKTDGDGYFLLLLKKYCKIGLQSCLPFSIMIVVRFTAVEIYDRFGLQKINSFNLFSFLSRAAENRKECRLKNMMYDLVADLVQDVANQKGARMKSNLVVTLDPFVNSALCVEAGLQSFVDFNDEYSFASDRHHEQREIFNNNNDNNDSTDRRGGGGGKRSRGGRLNNRAARASPIDELSKKRTKFIKYHFDAIAETQSWEAVKCWTFPMHTTLTAESLKKRRAPTVGLAMLATAISGSSDNPALSFLLIEGEKSRPSSHLIVRWPSSPLPVNNFFSHLIKEIHPQYLFPMHHHLATFLIHRQQLLTKESSQDSTKPLGQFLRDDRDLFDVQQSQILWSSEQTADALFGDAQKFRAARASGTEVDSVLQRESIIFGEKDPAPLNRGFDGIHWQRGDAIASRSVSGVEKRVMTKLLSNSFICPSEEVRNATNVIAASSLELRNSSIFANMTQRTSRGFTPGGANLLFREIKCDPKANQFGWTDPRLEQLAKFESAELKRERTQKMISLKDGSGNNSNTIDKKVETQDDAQMEMMLESVLEKTRAIDQVVHFDEISSPLFMRNIFSKSVTSFEWEFRDVSFAYPSTSTDSPPLVLKDISFTIPASVKSCGICGESGGGKSSILALMLKVYQPTKGEILLNGVNINDIPARWLRRHMAYVGPGSKLFKSQTARGQVLTANPLIENDVDATKALREACVPERMFADDEQGGNARIEKKPENPAVAVPKIDLMSGGEQQRVQIARAFGKMVMSRKTTSSQENGVDGDDEDEEASDEDVFSDDRVIALLFDEGTSALDAKTEEQIVKAIEDTGRSTSITRFMIAHRLFTIRDCDTILVIHNHRLIIKGKFFECARKAHRALEIAKEESKNEQQRKNATSSFSKHTLAGLKWFYDGVEKQTLGGEFEKFRQFATGFTADDEQDPLFSKYHRRKQQPLQYNLFSSGAQCGDQTKGELRAEILAILGSDAAEAFDRLME